MAEYKVRIADKVYQVSGFTELVELAKSGRLGPKDPVFVPRTGKWHYASSIRQLREYFTEVPTPSAAEDSARIARPDFTPARPIDPRGPQAQQAPAEVLPLRRPEPVGDPIEVEVFFYEVDARTPVWLRRVVLFGAVGVFGFGLLIGVVMIQEQGARIDENGYEPVSSTRRNVRQFRQVEDDATPQPTTRRSDKKSSAAAPTPRPTPSVQLAVLRADVKRLPGGRPKSIEGLSQQISRDLTRMKVPVRDVTIRVARTRKKQTVVPYIVVVTYAHKPGAGDRRRAAIGLVVGRAMTQSRLNVGTVQLRGHRGGKIVHKRRISGAHIKQFYQGGSLGQFEGRLKK